VLAFWDEIDAFKTQLKLSEGKPECARRGAAAAAAPPPPAPPRKPPRPGASRPRRAAPRRRYVFYDGPPFATGLPHYGHILAGTIKDVVTRYACATGHHCTRRFGWDCHGLPVEYEIDKALGARAARGAARARCSATRRRARPLSRGRARASRRHQEQG
jgi:hypothetical protein